MIDRPVSRVLGESGVVLNVCWRAEASAAIFPLQHDGRLLHHIGHSRFSWAQMHDRLGSNDMETGLFQFLWKVKGVARV